MYQALVSLIEMTSNIEKVLFLGLLRKVKRGKKTFHDSF